MTAGDMAVLMPGQGWTCQPLPLTSVIFTACWSSWEFTRAALVGHSDGGTIALYFAAQYPDQVTCLVTVAAHIYVEPKMEPGILGIQQAFETDEHFRTGLRYAHGAKYESVFHNWFDGWHRIESLSWDMRPIIRPDQMPGIDRAG